MTLPVSDTRNLSDSMETLLIHAEKLNAVLDQGADYNNIFIWSNKKGEIFFEKKERKLKQAIKRLNFQKYSLKSTKKNTLKLIQLLKPLQGKPIEEIRQTLEECGKKEKIKDIKVFIEQIQALVEAQKKATSQTFFQKIIRKIKWKGSSSEKTLPVEKELKNVLSLLFPPIQEVKEKLPLLQKDLERLQQEKEKITTIKQGLSENSAFVATISSLANTYLHILNNQIQKLEKLLNEVEKKIRSGDWDAETFYEEVKQCNLSSYDFRKEMNDFLAEVVNSLKDAKDKNLFNELCEQAQKLKMFTTPQEFFDSVAEIEFCISKLLSKENDMESVISSGGDGFISSLVVKVKGFINWLNPWRQEEKAAQEPEKKRVVSLEKNETSSSKSSVTSFLLPVAITAESVKEVAFTLDDPLPPLFGKLSDVLSSRMLGWVAKKIVIGPLQDTIEKALAIKKLRKDKEEIKGITKKLYAFACKVVKQKTLREMQEECKEIVIFMVKEGFIIDNEKDAIIKVIPSLVLKAGEELKDVEISARSLSNKEVLKKRILDFVMKHVIPVMNQFESSKGLDALIPRL